MINRCHQKTSELKTFDAPAALSFLPGLDFFDGVRMKQRHRLTDTQWKDCKSLLGAKAVSN